MITEGGEVGFVQRIINESLHLKSKIRWYTSMVGKKSSLRILRSYLREKAVKNHLTTEFVQGYTHRWGIAWTFTEVPMKEVKNPQTLPKLLEFVGFVSSQDAVAKIRQFLQTHEIFNEMMVTPRTDECTEIIGHFTDDVWSRKARRKKLKLIKDKPIAEGFQSNEALIHYKFHISIKPASKDQTIIQMERLLFEGNPDKLNTTHLFLSLYDNIKKQFKVDGKDNS